MRPGNLLLLRGSKFDTFSTTVVCQIHRTFPIMVPGTTTAIAIAAAATTKAANSVDLDDWSLRNWPAVVFHYVKNTLFLVSAIAGVVLSLALALFIVILLGGLIVKAVCYFRNKGKKGEQAAGSDTRQEQIPMEGREAGDEEAAGQPLMAREHDEDVDEAEELPPKYDGR